MADNITLSAGDGDGSTVATAQLTISGDTADVQMIGCGILSGSEGSWTYSNIVGGAGAVAAGVPRVTLASDDPAVAKLTTIDTDTGNMATDLAALEVLVTAGNVDLAAMEVLLGTIDTDTGNMATDLAALEVLQTAANVDLAAIEVLLGTIDTDTGNCATDLAALEVLVTAGNVDLAAIEVLQTTIAAQTTICAEALAGVITVDLAGNNDVTLAELPDTAAGDLAAMVVDLAAIEALLGTIDTDTGNIATSAATTAAQTTICAEALAGTVTVDGTVAVTHDALTELASAIDTEVQCDIVGALPAGTNAIGKLAANSGVDIGDVDVTSIAAGTNVIGGTFAALDSRYAYNGITQCEVYEFTVVGTTAGNNTLVGQTEDRKIRILSLSMLALSSTANTVKLVNDDHYLLGSAAAALPIAMDADGDYLAGWNSPANPNWRLTTDTVNESLVAVQSSTAPIQYIGTYILVI